MIAHKLAVLEQINEQADEVYLTSRQLAERIPLTHGSIRQYIYHGRFTEGVHFVKKGQRVLFLWSAVKVWLATKERPASEPEPRGEIVPFPNSRRRS